MVLVERAGLPTGAIALATLFGTCVECFDYFRVPRSLKKDLEILFVRLDVEKTRILLWANAIGILNSKSEGRDPQLQDDEVEKSVERCLWSIRTLLTDAEGLQNQYGLRPATEGSTSRAPKDLPSANGVAMFRASYNRFCVRYSGSQGRVSALSKEKWTIYDKPKFEILVNDLRGLVDGLIQVVQVKQESQDQIVREDISSIVDISRLRLVQDACEGTYPAWSEITDKVIEASESGTADRRKVEELIRDGKGLDKVVSQAEPQPSAQADAEIPRTSTPTPF